jgi:hypothetical protein
VFDQEVLEKEQEDIESGIEKEQFTYKKYLADLTPWIV